MCVELGRKSGVVDAAFCNHGQQPRILFPGRKEGSVVIMEETLVMSTATFLDLLS